MKMDCSPFALRSKYLERDLEDWIERSPEVLVGDEPLLIIGRQVDTPVGVIDLLSAICRKSTGDIAL